MGIDPVYTAGGEHAGCECGKAVANHKHIFAMLGVGKDVLPGKCAGLFSHALAAQAKPVVLLGGRSAVGVGVKTAHILPGLIVVLYQQYGKLRALSCREAAKMKKAFGKIVPVHFCFYWRKGSDWRQPKKVAQKNHFAPVRGGLLLFVHDQNGLLGLGCKVCRQPSIFAAL